MYEPVDAKDDFVALDAYEDGAPSASEPETDAPDTPSDNDGDEYQPSSDDDVQRTRKPTALSSRYVDGYAAEDDSTTKSKQSRPKRVCMPVFLELMTVKEATRKSVPRLSVLVYVLIRSLSCSVIVSNYGWSIRAHKYDVL